MGAELSRQQQRGQGHYHHGEEENKTSSRRDRPEPEQPPPAPKTAPVTPVKSLLEARLELLEPLDILQVQYLSSL